MTFYQYALDYRFADVGLKRATRQLQAQLDDVKPLASRWRPPNAVFELRLGPPADCSMLDPGIGPFPVFSETAWNALAPLIGNEAEALPIKTRGVTKAYFIIHPIGTVDCLNTAKS